jgi:Xaa-Pro aminopeptidase
MDAVRSNNTQGGKNMNTGVYHPSDDLASRVRAAREGMRQQGLDACLLLTRANKYYFSGFDHYLADDHSTSFLYITEGGCYFGVNRMERTAACEHTRGCEVVAAEQKNEGMAELLARIAAREGIPRTIGYEERALQHYDALRLKDALPQTALVVTDLAERQRYIKSAGESAALESAMDAADRALLSVLPKVAVGVTERQVAWMLEAAAREEEGADELSFPVIVASGLNSAKPHHMPTDKPLAAGDFVTIDFGVRKGCYCSDTTRTFVMGEPGGRHREVYDAVLAAQEAAHAAARPGMSGKDLDAVARSIIEERGYGEHFTHSLGHGVGLDIHEPPWIAPYDETPLEVGMVFSIEPGIYIEGFGGVRIEDSVVLEREGARALTKTPKGLVAL